MKRLIYIFSLFLLALPLSAGASTLPSEEKARIETYLNSLTTMQADFIQMAPDGSTASGEFYLSRPGKLRWDYHPPVPLLVIVNGFQLIYYDEELGEVTHIPTSATLASYLTRPNLTLDGDVEVADFKKEKGSVRVTLADAKEDYDGSLTLVFSDNPLTLRKLEVVDAMGQTTVVALNNQQYDVKLDNKLFVLENAKTFHKKN